MSNLIFQQQGSSPSDAGSGYSQIYAKSDGKVYRQAGTDSEVEISGLAMADITSASSLSGSNVVAKAWAKFPGSTTGTVDTAFNVSSITDTATGRFGVNFSTDMTDVNYCAVVSNGDDSVNTNRNVWSSVANQAAGSFEINCYNSSNFDPDNVYCVVFDS